MPMAVKACQPYSSKYHPKCRLHTRTHSNGNGVACSTYNRDSSDTM